MPIEKVVRRAILAYDRPMIPSLSRGPRRLVSSAILMSLAVPLPASGATVRKGKVTKVAPTPAKADNSIIALPLNPIVPSAQRLCEARTATGLGYTMLRTAAGTKPADSDVVLVNYVGYLATTGAVFDQGMRSAFPVSGVIPGFSQGLSMLAKSGVARFCVPAALGYGARATGPIPANADLVFQVELLDYKTAAEVETMNKAGTNAPVAQDAVPKP